MDPKTKLPYALITGASSGIGAEFARQLAKDGNNLILSARREDRLHELGHELKQTYDVQMECYATDLSTDGGIRRLEERLAREPYVELLVNSAGFGGRGEFATADPGHHLDMVKVHVEAPMRLTYAALPGMLSANRGGVINVSSIAAFFPLRSVNYSATKAYLVNFSLALANELRRTGVHVQALCPGFTYTEFHDERHRLGFRRSDIPSILWLKTAPVVSESLRTFRRGSGLCIPSLQYKLIAFIGRSPILSPLLKIPGRFLRR